MAALESLEHRPHQGKHAWSFRFGVKVPVGMLISLFLVVAVWYAAPSGLSPTRFSLAQLEVSMTSPSVMEANNRPPVPNTPPKSMPIAINDTQLEFQQSERNITASDRTEEFPGNKHADDTPSPSSSEIIVSDSSIIDELDVNPLDPEPLTPVASRRPDVDSSNSHNGPSTPPVPDSDSSPLLQDPTIKVEENTAEKHSELYRMAPAPSENPVVNETSPAAVPLAGLLESEPERQQGERYMFPMLSSFVGTGNQLMEYKSAAVIARTLNRTLCLAPFFGGPGRHFGYLGSNHYGLQIEDRFDLKEFSRFVKLASIHECIEKCNGTLDRVWRLRASRSSDWSWWFPRIPPPIKDFDRQYGKWMTPKDIAQIVGQLNEEPEAKCVGMGGAFPGLRWRGAMWAASAYMIHTQSITNASDVFQARALGTGPYISVHWRFEESFCSVHQLGLCFTRCNDGALIGGGLKSPRYKDLPTMIENFRAGFHGAGLAREDIAAALFDKAVEQGVGTVYLSTDGWLRGKECQENIKWVVEDIRKRGMNVSGLWEIEGLPNLSDGTYIFPQDMPGLFGLMPGRKVSNHMIALVEQEICMRSVVFLGSGQSSWSLAVFDARRSRRRRLDLEASVRSNHTGVQRPLAEPEVDQAVIERLYEDKHAAGPACHGQMGMTPETYEDEAPDGWLDYEACEKRIDLGGRCVRLVPAIAH